MIKYVYEIDYPLGEKRKYLEWVRSVADTLQAPGELTGLASYDNAFSATPQRVVEFTFESLEDAGRYFGRKEISRISKASCQRIAATSASRFWRCAVTTARTPRAGRLLPGTTGPRSCPRAPGPALTAAKPGARGSAGSRRQLAGTRPARDERDQSAAQPATTSR